ncbi:MAG: outer membrane lipoprotein carrier protein LolA [Verrucomicrobia bacterium]|nr:outer membrane lipoprotein carrier protein LolA [Verrucomicrobiota bacterium]
MPTSLKKRFVLWIGFFLLTGWGVSAMANAALGTPEDDALLDRWLHAQTNLVTWSSEFVQTRKFPTLVNPLTTPGRVAFKAPHSFRWQLGEPVKTVAVRLTDEVLIYYPRLKRAERYPLSTDAKGPWKDAMSLLDAGFPRSRAELEDRFEIVKMEQRDGVGLLSLVPKSLRSRRILTRLRIEFGVQSLEMEAAEFEFADGSLMRTAYQNPSSNPELPDDLFELKLNPEVQVLEPASK